MANYILGGLLIVYTIVSLRYGNPWLALVTSACAVIILGSKLWGELNK
jgi:hypothetical protein